MRRSSTKEKVLNVLSAFPGTCFSGQELAEKLKVSRTAVWKAIEALREEGIAVEGEAGKGYTLAPDSDVLSAEAVNAALCEEARLFYRPECVKFTGSTNDDVKKRGDAGCEEGLVILAEAQTKGRGRQGRVFYSPGGSGLYLSILLRPAIPLSEAVLITAAAAVAAARAAEETAGLTPGSVQIKWVNDLYLSGRKICGILTEGTLSIENGGFEQAVLGVGFNLFEPDGGFPEEIKETAGSLFAEKEKTGSRAGLAADFLNAFLPFYRRLSDKRFLAEYEERQLVLGKDIEVLFGNGEKKKAKALGLDEGCRLLVRYEGEEKETVLSGGEVRILPQEK